MEANKSRSAKLLLALIPLVILMGASSAEEVSAYSAVTDRPVFLAWPLPSYIGLARISQFPNTPWTWNFLELNPGQQCPPAFGFLSNAEFWPLWKDDSVPVAQDMAQADPHNFEMVNCYSTLGIAGENGHEGTDIKAPPDTPVYASAAGKVAGWRADTINSMFVLKHCLGGQWDVANECEGGTECYTTYMHMTPAIDLLEIGKDVAEGAKIGVILNQGDNSHLHFEVGLDQRSYLNYVNPWGRDTAPWYGCMWMDQSLCVQPNPGYERIGILTGSGRLFVRDDDRSLVEIFQTEEISQFQMAGPRMAIIDQNGHLLSKDVEFKRTLPLGHEFLMNWVDLGGGYVDFQVTANRIAVLDADGTFKVKEGDLSSAWTSQIEDIQSFSISEHRVGVLTPDGQLMIKEGKLDQDWLVLAVYVKAFQVLDSRIAVVDLQGNLFVQEGVMTSEWKPMGADVRSFQLSGTRVAVLDANGDLLVNDGNLRAPWVLQAQNVRQYQLADQRIVILDRDGKWMIKDGDLYQDWKTLEGLTAQDVRLNGEWPVIVGPVE